MVNEDGWFYLGSDDVPKGPVSRTELLELVRLGHAGASAMIWRDGFAGWRSFHDVEAEWKNPAAQSGARQPVTVQPARKQPATRDSPLKQAPARARAAVRSVRRIERTHLILGSAFAAAAIVIVSGLYRYSGPTVSHSSLAQAVVHETALPPPIDVAPEAEALPVLVKNPFDASEVFEFPPGTSEMAARDAVADLLLKRAMERRSQIPERRAKSKTLERRTKKRA
jgi:hypothetical protein